MVSSGPTLGPPGAPPASASRPPGGWCPFPFAFNVLALLQGAGNGSRGRTFAHLLHRPPDPLRVAAQEAGRGGAGRDGDAARESDAPVTPAVPGRAAGRLGDGQEV